MILLKICVHGQKNNEECERDAEVLIDASKRAGKQKPQHKFIKIRIFSTKAYFKQNRLDKIFSS